MTNDDAIGYELRDGLAVISLNRPEKRNAVDIAMFRAIAAAADRANGDPDARGILVRAEGPSFCAGIDLLALAGLAGAASERFQEFVSIAQAPYLALARAGMPVVAAVRGHALGAGFQLALACDARVVATDASFGLLEARFGLIPDLGGMWHLAREIGPSRTKELAWTARTVDAGEADRMGLVNRLVSPEHLDAEAESFAREMMSYSPVTAAAVKELVGRAGETSLEEELAAEAAAQRRVLNSADHTEAVAAFLERRPPRFTGR
jgi:2-(1,2-epoxy-1,2-dihydrophenyl)acetyl-CoA isomerase